MDGNKLFDLVKKACSVHIDKARSAHIIINAYKFKDDQLTDAFKYAQIAKVYGHLNNKGMKSIFYNHCREEFFNVIKNKS
jgi:hypothetical protein